MRDAKLKFLRKNLHPQLYSNILEELKLIQKQKLIFS